MSRLSLNFPIIQSPPHLTHSLSHSPHKISNILLASLSPNILSDQTFFPSPLSVTCGQKAPSHRPRLTRAMFNNASPFRRLSFWCLRVILPDLRPSNDDFLSDCGPAAKPWSTRNGQFRPPDEFRTTLGWSRTLSDSEQPAIAPARSHNRATSNYSRDTSAGFGIQHGGQPGDGQPGSSRSVVNPRLSRDA